MTAQFANDGSPGEPAEQFPVQPLKARGDRLRDAVRQAGGTRAVSQKAGIPPSTLHNYLSGQEMKLSQVVALASATGVRLDWLVSGDGPMRTDLAEPALPLDAPEPQNSAPSGAQERLEHTMSAIAASARALESGAIAGVSIWDMIDFDALVMCFELQEDLDKMGAGQLKSVRSRMRRAFNVYDMKKNDQEP